MSNATLSEQAVKSHTLPAIPALMTSIYYPLGWSASNIIGDPTILVTGGVQTPYAPAVLLDQTLLTGLENVPATAGIAWLRDAQPAAPDLETPAGASIYDAVVDSIAESAACPFSGVVSIHPTALNVTYASAKGSHYVYAPHKSQMLLYRPSVLDVFPTEIEHADESIGSLQLELDRIIQLTSGSPDPGSADVDEETIKTCKSFIRILSAYIVRNSATDPDPFIVPSPDGTIFFKWLRGEKELSVTIEQSTLQVQRWTPLASYESEGYWEVSLDEVGEHFDWLTR